MESVELEHQGKHRETGSLDPCRGEPDGLSPPDKNPLDKRGPNRTRVQRCDKQGSTVRQNTKGRTARRKDIERNGVNKPWEDSGNRARNAPLAPHG